MKKLYILYLLLFSLAMYAQPNIGQPLDLTACDTDGSGYTTFDLTMNNAPVLGNLNPNDYSVTYYLNEASMLAGVALPYMYTNTSPNQVIYVQVTGNNFSDFATFNLTVHSAPAINAPTPLTLCNEMLPNDGLTTFDLTTKNNEITGTCLGCTVEYFQQGDNNPIAMPTAYVNTTSPQTLSVKVTSVDGCTSFTTLTLKVLPLPLSVELPALFSCEGIFDLTENSNLFEPTVTVTYYTTVADAANDVNPIVNSAAYASTTGSVWARASIITENPAEPACYTLQEQQLVAADFEITGITAVGNDIIINLSAPGTYQYTVISAPAGADLTSQTSNIFTDLPFGSYTFAIENSCGNVITITYTFTLTAPAGETTQTFTEGDTLADLDVEGENLKWYQTETSQEVLPLSTLLVNGTTYYVSQTVNGEESARLGVTVNLPLGVSTNKFAGLSYYPNPVKDVFTVSNNNAIDAVSIFNIMGQQVVSKTVNNTNTMVDFSALNSGVYFVQLSSGGSQRTIKVVKG